MGRGHRRGIRQHAREVPQGGMRQTRPLRYPHRYPRGKSSTGTVDFRCVRRVDRLLNTQFPYPPATGAPLSAERGSRLPTMGPNNLRIADRYRPGKVGPGEGGRVLDFSD